MAQKSQNLRPSSLSPNNGTQTSGESSNSVTSPPSRRSSSGGTETPRERHRVRFTPGGESLDPQNQRATFNLRDRSQSPPRSEHAAALYEELYRLSSRRAAESNDDSQEDQGMQRPRGSLNRSNSDVSEFDDISEVDEEDHEDHEDHGKHNSQSSAQARAQRLAKTVGSQSAPVSTHHTPLHSPPRSPPRSPPPGGPNGMPVHNDDIPMVDLEKRQRHVDADTESEEEDEPRKRHRGRSTSEAHQLVRMHTMRARDHDPESRRNSTETASGYGTPQVDRDPHDYVPPPNQYRGGILASLLKLYNASGNVIGGMPSGPGFNPAGYRHGSDDSRRVSPAHSPDTPGSSGTATPRGKNQKWYNKSANQSTTSLAGLVESTAKFATPVGGLGGHVPARKTRPRNPRRASGGKVGAALNRMSKPRLEDEIKITVHIAETLSRQKYIVKLCRALMSYGAPTHRLEEYLRMTARVLEIDGQFLYIPGCMLVSFDDSSTHTTEVKIVRSAQGVDLGKLRDTHEIYKEVVHDVIGVEEATQRLDEVMKRKQKFHRWLLVVVYGLASATVGPFAFQAQPIDLPIAFLLGAILGVLQLIFAPKSELYANVFEISAAVLTSFLARAFGSIRGGQFCFSALAQSAIALILPGYTVLCGSLELQSKSIVAGSVRMVYAIIYSVFLGFGITIGTAIYGLIDADAASATTCSDELPEYYRFFFVPAFTLCLIVINQAKWKQAPVMIVIAFAGYIVNFFSAKRFSQNAQIANSLGAFAVGVLGNLYSRVGHGLAAAALLPAIFVQVPSGLAASGSLVSGITSANELVRNANSTNSTTVSSASDDHNVNSVVLNVGFSMIQVAIGITVGLFLSALVIYPFGKRRSGLFSF
ncbi:MAG: hypothetical protein M1833_003877 [Piccolia ochrophora]|nr:MAG: hypothetical protein M1833_003877 [Piccolia ochrophora]